MKRSDFFRKLLTQGFVNPRPTIAAIDQLSELRKLMISSRNNFERIANYMKYKDPATERECREIAQAFKTLLSKL